MAATALALLALAGCGSDEGGAAVTSTPDQATTTAATSGTQPPADAPLLGVLDATAGTWDGDALTLTGVRPDGTWFTDRPARQAGTTPIDDFLPLFFTGDDPPNAAIQLTGADDGADVAIVELTDPQWDPDTGELTLTATPIDPDDALATTHPGLANQLDRADDTLPTTFGAAALFIDTGDGAGEAPEEPTGAVPTTQLTPVAVITADDVQQLASNYQTLYDDMVDVASAQRVLVEQQRDGQNSCQMAFLETILDEATDVNNTIDDVIDPLVAAVANGQDLPEADGAKYQQALRDYQQGEVNLIQAQGINESGGCPEG